jgi:hypothetical protein
VAVDEKVPVGDIVVLLEGVNVGLAVVEGVPEAVGDAEGDAQGHTCNRPLSSHETAVP